MAFEKVKAYFAQAGLEDRVMEFEDSSATVELAAEAVGCEAKQIVKTLSFLVDGEPILLAMAGDARVANPKFKAEFHSKPVMIPLEQVEHYIGHGIGGVCPFAVKDGVKVYLDASIRRFREVYPAAGSSNSAVRLTVPELEQYACAVKWVDVGKGWQDAGEE